MNSEELVLAYNTPTLFPPKLFTLHLEYLISFGLNATPETIFASMAGAVL
jgi:hypothetical protein